MDLSMANGSFDMLGRYSPPATSMRPRSLRRRAGRWKRRPGRNGAELIPPDRKLWPSTISIHVLGTVGLSPVFQRAVRRIGGPAGMNCACSRISRGRSEFLGCALPGRTGCAIFAGSLAVACFLPSGVRTTRRLVDRRRRRTRETKWSARSASTSNDLHVVFGVGAARAGLANE